MRISSTNLVVRWLSVTKPTSVSRKSFSVLALTPSDISDICLPRAARASVRASKTAFVASVFWLNSPIEVVIFERKAASCCSMGSAMAAWYKCH